MKSKEKDQSKKLRAKGYSINQIFKIVQVSKSSVSLWVRDVKLSKTAKHILKAHTLEARKTSAKAKKQKILDKYSQLGDKLLKTTNIDDNFLKICCGLIYWCEGGTHDDNRIQFTNSNPQIIKTFMILLRRLYIIDERRFRISLHIHSYHQAKDQINYWSKITKVPTNQFNKPYLKQNTSIRKKPDYQGCVNIRYSDTSLTRTIIATGKAFFKHMGD